MSGWDSIREILSASFSGSLAADCYTGVYEDEVIAELSKGYDKVINTRDLMQPESEIIAMTAPIMTDDVLFG